MSVPTFEAIDLAPPLNSKLQQQVSRFRGMGILLMTWVPFIVGAAGTSALLNALRPGPTHSYISIYTEKCRAVSQSADSPTVLVVGTSRMFNGIDPRVVEDELNKSGRPMSVWNLSLHAMTLAEQAQVLSDAFTRLNLRPELVIYEPPLKLGMALENATVARSVYFTGWRGFRHASRFIQAADRGIARKYFNLGCCGVYFAVGLTNYGLFSDRLFPDRYQVNELSDQKTQLLVSSKGFRPSSMEDHPSEDVEQFASVAADIEKRGRSATDLLPPKQMAQIHAVDAFIKAHGAASLAVLMPKYYIYEPYYQKAEFQLARSLAAATDIDSIDYLNRVDHPGLYCPEMWSDDNHLSDAGSDVFSREIAREIIHQLGGSN